MRRLVAVFSSKRDKYNPPPPLITDNAHSSASSSSGSASLCLHTPDDEHHPIEIVDRRSKKTWKSFLQSSKSHRFSQQKPRHSLVSDWTHELDDTKAYPLAGDQSRKTTNEDVRNSFTIIVKNSLRSHPTSPSPFAHRPNSPTRFPTSAVHPNTLPHRNTLASQMLKKRLLARLQNNDRPPSQSELQSIAPLISRKAPPLLATAGDRSLDTVNEPAPSKATVFTLSSPGLSRWASRPCFEDRFDVFFPQVDGSLSRSHVVGSGFAVAALEYSTALEAMIDFEPPENVQDTSPLVIEVPSSPTSDSISTPSSPGHNRNSPYITVPSPLRNEHNLPSPPPLLIEHDLSSSHIVGAAQSAPPANPSPPASDPLIKRGVRFAEDDKEDAVPLGYVLRTKQQRLEKAKFLKAEQERRLLQEERKRLEEERQQRDLERVEWEKEKRAWEKEKRAIEEEKQNRKYAEEVAAARQRRESQRAGGVPALKGSDTDSHGYLGSTGRHFPASVTSSVSGRNRASPSRRHSRPVYNDEGVPTVYLPRREASEPNLPTITKTSPNDTHLTVNYPRHDSSNSHSPSSSHLDSAESSSPLPGTRSPSVYSSSSEDVKAAVARAKRSSLAASASRNNSSTSITGDRPYSAEGGSSSSLHRMVMNTGMVPPVPPLPMMPMQMQMVPMPAYMVDMPLLPPTPPFMMQQYPRRHGSPGRSSRNSSNVRLSGSQSSSRERVDVISGSGSGTTDGSYSNGHSTRSSSFSRPEFHASSSSPGSSPQTPSTHGSGVVGGHDGGPPPRRASMPAQSPQQYMQSQRQRQNSYNERRSSNSAQPQLRPTSMSRGISSQHLQPPSPWTGLPTQSGNLPNANASMTTKQLQQSTLRKGASKRQTMIV